MGQFDLLVLFGIRKGLHVGWWQPVSALLGESSEFAIGAYTGILWVALPPAGPHFDWAAVFYYYIS